MWFSLANNCMVSTLFYLSVRHILSPMLSFSCHELDRTNKHNRNFNSTWAPQADSWKGINLSCFLLICFRFAKQKMRCILHCPPYPALTNRQYGEQPTAVPLSASSHPTFPSTPSSSLLYSAYICSCPLTTLALPPAMCSAFCSDSFIICSSDLGWSTTKILEGTGTYTASTTNNNQKKYSDI